MNAILRPNAGPNRLLSLDVFRGITIVGMILVNNPGTWSHVYAPLRHASWHGLTPTDLVFPFFMLIMGVSMSYAFARFNHHINREFMLKLVRRSGLLFLIGMLISLISLLCSGNEAPLAHIRILGVLQRLALAYFGGALVVMSIKRNRRLLEVAAGILIAYAAILLLGHGFELSPDNIIGVIDRNLFGEAHIYRVRMADGTPLAFDPEGLLSALPGVAQVVIGYVCGNLLREKRDMQGRLLRLAVLGAVMLFAGYLLSYGCPINKKIWSPTFVLTTCGAGALALMLLTWIIDVRGRRNWTMPLRDFGLNPLFIYVLSDLIAILLRNIKIHDASLRSLAYDALASIVGDGCFASLLYAVAFVGVCYAVAAAMARRGIVVKL